MKIVEALINLFSKFKGVIAALIAYTIGKNRGKIEFENDLLKAQLHARELRKPKMKLIHDKYKRIKDRFNRGITNNPKPVLAFKKKDSSRTD